MKKHRQRLVVLDYFRGVCILAILLTHSHIFSRPFAYLSGIGSLWISAAEMFFLLSGITLGVVRGEAIISDFKSVLLKSWRRARDLYLLYILTTLGTALLASFFISHSLHNMIVPVHYENGLPLLIGIFDFKFSMGLANFLEYYAVYMLFAPFVMYALYKKYWPAVLLSSYLLFILSASYPLHLLHLGDYTWFATWQLYFILGLLIARFRYAILGFLFGNSGKTAAAVRKTVTIVAAAVLALSVSVGFNFYHPISRLTDSGWLPANLRLAYLKLLGYKPSLAHWLMSGRTGILRPFVALLILAGAYLFYQKHKEKILKFNGRFVTAMGRDTLWIFVIQALVIPIMASLPVRRNLATNTAMTATLIGSMWLLTQRRVIIAYCRSYFAGLKYSYNEAKYAYLSQFEDSN